MPASFILLSPLPRGHLHWEVPLITPPHLFVALPYRSVLFCSSFYFTWLFLFVIFCLFHWKESATKVRFCIYSTMNNVCPLAEMLNKYFLSDCISPVQLCKRTLQLNWSSNGIFCKQLVKHINSGMWNFSSSFLTSHSFRGSRKIYRLSTCPCD